MQLVAVYIGSFKGINNLLIPLNSAFTCSGDEKSITIKRKTKLDTYYSDNNLSLILGQNGTGKTTIIEFIESLYTSMKGEGLGVFFDNNDKYTICTNLSNVPTLDFDSLIDDLNYIPEKEGGLLSVNNIFDIGKFTLKESEKLTKSFLKINSNTLVDKGRKKAFNEDVTNELTFFEKNADFMSSIGNAEPQFIFKLFRPSRSRYTNVIKKITKLKLPIYSEIEFFENNKLLSKNSHESASKHFYKNVSVVNKESSFLPEAYDNQEEPSEEKFKLDEIGRYIFDRSMYNNLSKEKGPPLWPIIQFFLSDLIWKAAQNTFTNLDERDYFYLTALLYGFENLSNFSSDGDHYVTSKLSEAPTDELYLEISDATNIILDIALKMEEEDIKFINADDGVYFHCKDSEIINDFSYLFSKLNEYIVQPVYFGWTGFSSGESALIKLYSRVFNGVHKLRSFGHSSILLVMDEVDLYLHPEWQQSFLKRLLLFVNSIKLSDEVIQVVLSSHSPLIASDFLPEDIVTLRKVRGKTEKLANSFGFGTGINQLYSSSFSLDSTIGQYSRELLNEIFNKIKTKELTPFEKELVSRIGDELIRNNIQEYLVDDSNKL